MDDMNKAIEESMVTFGVEKSRREEPTTENLQKVLAENAELRNVLTETERSNYRVVVAISELTLKSKNDDDMIASLQTQNGAFELDNLSLRIKNLRLQKQILYLHQQSESGESGQTFSNNPFSSNYSGDLSSC